ncbi:hypothetical protein TWF730_009894 [Orbilia blumenaviensis]|uniref:Uncharacterized protein n=1 Tax=Orbilia blumenaviensis TaxID=1796055 RepID=A0AAV9UUI9_9PEZI
MTKKTSPPPNPQDIFSTFFSTPTPEQSGSPPHQNQTSFLFQPRQPQFPNNSSSSIKMAIFSRLFNRMKRKSSSEQEPTGKNDTTVVPQVVVSNPQRDTKTGAPQPKSNYSPARSRPSGGGGGGSGVNNHNFVALNSMLSTSLNPDSSYGHSHHNHHSGSGDHCSSSSYTYSSGGGGGSSSYSSGGDGGGGGSSSSGGGDGGGSSSCGGGF